MKTLHVCALAVGACFGSALTAWAQLTYKNPIPDLAPMTGYSANAHKDPRLMRSPQDNLWYNFYPSGTSYTSFHSADLVNWQAAGPAQTALSVSDLQAQGSSFWAAGTYAQLNNGVWTYYLYYTLIQGSTKSIGVASSITPAQGYVDQGILLQGGASDSFCPTGSGETSCEYYDAFVFRNPETGVVWLYFSDTMHALYARKLTSPVNPAANANTEPINTADSAWHKVLDLNIDHQSWEASVMEHPTVVYFPHAHSGAHKFQLIWNGAGGATPRYALGAAYSGDPVTLFNKEPEGTCGVSGYNPIMCMTQTMYTCSVGSPSIFIDSNSQWWLFYRARYGELTADPSTRCSTSSDPNAPTNHDWTDRWSAMDKLYRDVNTDALTIHPTYTTTETAPQF